ncbi:hypothetical protein FQN55_004524 [Onygenales sp. PD_40]|nr:hypothetical protein FQN55_004524 [Onygenales sp. PD_40]KAK2775799.1 hypothetical protein FQN52_003878 [Onygenales sp. PD_12]
MAPTEATRYELSARLFRCPFTLYLTDNPSPANPHRIRAPYSPTHFPLKDIALYNLASATGDTGDTVEPLFDTIWKSWYPRRNLHPAVDGCAEGFFCRAFRLCVGDARRGGVGGGEEREGVLRALMGFHGGLVRGVEGVLRGVREGRGRGKRVGGEDLGLDLEVRWGLLESFREVVVVVDRREWEGEGVLVVVRGDRVGKFGVEGRGGDLVCEFELGEEGGDDEGGMGTGTCHRWLAYRMGLEDAVKTIICDPERKKALAPTVEYYREKSFGF